jgi:hypothetical protein
MKDIRSLSIFSFNSGWKTFFRAFLTLVAVLFIGGYAFILVVDPYDSIPFSPNWERVPVDRDQPFFYPGLARSARFDSAIIGTSTVRLLRPVDLNRKFSSRFVNLAMNAASVSMQEAILDIFLRHHPNPKTIIIGIDHVHFKAKHFQPQLADPSIWPAWLYDQNPYNNFPPYRFRTLKHAWRQFLYLTGIQTYKYGRDGYTDFTKPMDEYDLRRARENIYGTPQPQPIQAIDPPFTMAPEAIRALAFPSLRYLERMLDKLPDETNKILIVTPFHHYAQPTPGSEEALRWQEFLRRLANVAENRPRTCVLNFNIPSPITMEDSHYWDPGHYTVKIAAQLAQLIAEGAHGGGENANYVRLVPMSDGREAEPGRARVKTPKESGAPTGEG